MPSPHHPAALDGVWSLVKSELGGEAAPQFLSLKIELEVHGGEYTVSFAGIVADRGTCALGANEEHHTVILQGLVGPNAGRTIPSIYRLADDELHVCYGLDGSEPAAFATAPGTQLFLATYRRKAT